MNVFLWIVAGAALGWLAYSALRFNAAWGMMVSIVIGAMGGVLGGKVLAPLFLGPTAAEGIAVPALFVAVVVSVASLAAANMLHNRFES